MEKVVLGQIVAPHGVRGDLRIMPLTSNTQLFMDMDYLLLPDDRRLHVVKARPHKNIMLVTVKEVASIEEADALRGQKVSVYRDDLPELPEKEIPNDGSENQITLNDALEQNPTEE